MKSTTLFVFLMGIAFFSHGQDVYWVTESNANVPGQTKVRIYDLNQVLLAEYQLNRDIRFFRKRDKRMLNQLAERTKNELEMVATRKTRKGRINYRLPKV